MLTSLFGNKKKTKGFFHIVLHPTHLTPHIVKVVCIVPSEQYNLFVVCDCHQCCFRLHNHSDLKSCHVLIKRLGTLHILCPPITSLWVIRGGLTRTVNHAHRSAVCYIVLCGCKKMWSCYWVSRGENDWIYEATNKCLSVRWFLYFIW